MRGGMLLRSVALLTAVVVGSGAAFGQLETWIAHIPYEADSRYDTWAGERDDYRPKTFLLLGYKGVAPDFSERPEAAIFSADVPSGPYGEVWWNQVAGSGHPLWPVSGEIYFTEPIEPGEYEIRVFPGDYYEAMPVAVHKFRVSDLTYLDDLELYNLARRPSREGSSWEDPAELLVDSLVRVRLEIPLHLDEPWIGLLPASANPLTAVDAAREAFAIQRIPQSQQGVGGYARFTSALEQVAFRIPPVNDDVEFLLYDGFGSDVRPFARSGTYSVAFQAPPGRDEDGSTLSLNIWHGDYFPQEPIRLYYLSLIHI